MPPNTDSTADAGGERPLLVLLDSHGIIFRSYYALRDVLTVRRTGEPVAAVFGYANSLLTVLNDLKPSHVIAAWDAAGQTFRAEKDDRYKATRQPIPDDLPPQIDRVRTLLDAFAIPLIEAPGFEADDVVGTLTEQAVAAGIDVMIVTLDVDMVQLVRPGVRLHMYRPYQRDYVIYDEDAVRDRWGFDPERMVDYKALVGDNSDNIPGVRGIGEKGAVALIKQYGTVDAMLEHLDEIEPARTRNALANGVEEARLSHELATIVRDVPEVTLDLEAARTAAYDRSRVIELFQELDFRSLIDRLPASDGDNEPVIEASSADVRVEIADDEAALGAVAAAVRASGRFSFELIADDDHPVRAHDRLVGVAIAAEEGAGWYVPIAPRAADHGGQGALDLGAEDVAEDSGGARVDPDIATAALADLLGDPALRRVAHNAKHAYVALTGHEEGPAWPIEFDTQIAAYLLGDSNMTLERLAFDRLRIHLDSTKDLLGSGRKAVEFAAADVQAVADFAVRRADAVLRLEAGLQSELEESELEAVYMDIDLPHVPVLAAVERRGVALDSDALQSLEQELSERIDAAEQEAYASVGHEFKLGSPQELSQVLFEDLELPKTRRTKTGYTTDANALEAMRHLHPLVNAVLEWRELTKIKSTYVDTLPLQVNPASGRVHTVLSQVTAATGRLSSNDPNLQNIPVRTEIGQAVRRAFVARDCGDDPILLSIDYSQIELRVLAHICGDEELRRAFDERRDIHAATAANVFHVTPDEVTSEMRRRAKVFNFGVLYGLTAFGLSQREGIPRDEADAFIDAYFAAYPSVQEWRESVVDEARERGYAETLTGRRRYIPELRARNRNVRQAAERIAINMPIQGTAADIIKIAMNRIEAEMAERRADGMQARLVLQVHDELIFELPRSELDDVREIAHRLMPSLELAVPLDLEDKWGQSWGDWE